MYDKTGYENIRSKDRVRDLASLSLFIVVSLAVSIVIMDLVIFPISLLSVANKSLFNALVTFATIGGVAGLLLSSLARTIIRMHKDGARPVSIALSIIIKPLKMLGIALIFVLISLLVIYVIYLLMNGNYYLLYKLMNR